jgi:hypothetical protein
VGGTHEEIADAREEWQSEIAASGASGVSTVLHHTRFGVVPGYDGPPIPAPPLPGGRLRPRGPSGTARKR